jgi:hypothetical protein
VADVAALVVVGFFHSTFCFSLGFLTLFPFAEILFGFTSFGIFPFLIRSLLSELEEELKLATELSSATPRSDDDEEDDEEISIIVESSPERFDLFFFDFF